MNSPEFSYATRKKHLESLDGSTREFTVIGGGITGSGVAALLAQNGIQPVLLDRSDFSSGTSSGSSKLIHGGLRYLAQGEVMLTRHLLKERNYLLKNVNFVTPLNFDILIDDNSWSKREITLGLFLYNLLAGRIALPRMKRNAGKYPEHVKGYFTYYDAYATDSVLVIHNIVSAVRNGASCINYANVESIEEVDDGHYRITVEDRATGRKISFRSKYIVNCAGPWVKEVADMIGVPGKGVFRLSKGVHLIFRKEDCPAVNAIAFRSHIDRRQMFVIPAGKVTIIGTTDTFVDSPDDFSVTDEDIHYIISSSKRLYPDLTAEKVLTSYSGIRPLFGTGETPGEISRDFYISSRGHAVSVFGGKLTDYRNVARKVARAVSAVSGRGIRTKGLPVIDYRRPEVIDGYDYYIDHECALTPEDVYRRRTAVSLYEPEFESLKEGIIETFRRVEEIPEIRPL